MKIILERNEFLMCMSLIYIDINKFLLHTNFLLYDYRSIIVNTILSVTLIVLMIILKRLSYYGITKVNNLKKYLYFLPLLLILSVKSADGAEIISTLF